MRHLRLFILAILITSCGASTPIVDNSDAASPQEDNNPNNRGNTNSDNPNIIEDPVRTPIVPKNKTFALDDYRSSLSDRYSSRKNDVPESFLAVNDEIEEEKDLFEGYRVQIFSGADVNIADSAASQFRIWADTTIAGYQPETYVFFRPPYYRVHVGDFHSQERANSYAQLVKRRFREAWVVYDRVDPYSVPADTARFTLIKRRN